MAYIGTDQPIHDARQKASGRQKYAGDYDFPGMAHLCMIFSPIAHGVIKSIDDSAALAMEGVYGVLHCFNTTDRMYNHYRTMLAQAEAFPGEERVFERHVRFVGDRVAAVAACDLETARKAAALVKIEYEELPAALTFEEALAGKNLPEGENPILDEATFDFGALPQEPYSVVETTSELSRLHHATMETHACVADYDPYGDFLTIYSPNQTVHGIRTVVADFLEMPYSHVRVVKSTMGGSFGGKQEWFVEPVAALAARQLRRPVKLVYRREDSMISTVVRGAFRGTLQGLYSPEGRILGFNVELLADAGAYFGNTGDYVRAFYGKFFRLYKVEYMHYHVRVVGTNTPASGAYRSWSAAEAATMIEHNVNQAAVQLGLDPIDVRLRSVLRPGDSDPKLKLPVEDYRAAEAIERGREKFRWDEKIAADRAFNASNRRYRRGVGIGCGAHGNTYFPRHQDFAAAELRLNEDGSVQAHISLHDHGCGTVQAFRMILAEALEVRPEDILLGEADTANTPFDYGCFASRTTFVVGGAAYGCAQKLREVMVANAAEITGIPAEDFYIENAVIRCKSDPNVCFTYGQIALQSTLKLRREVFAQYQHHNTTNPGVMGVGLAHVEVDTFTGMTKVLDYLAVHDIGQAINPALCVAQIQGGVQMGCGAALHEKMTVDKEGHTTASLSKYHLCLCPDMPNIEVELIQDGRSKEGPYGAKSIGEVAYVPPAAAVCAAVNNALGSNIGMLPMDPPVILKALEGGK